MTRDVGRVLVRKFCDKSLRLLVRRPALTVMQSSSRNSGTHIDWKLFAGATTSGMGPLSMLSDRSLLHVRTAVAYATNTVGKQLTELSGSARQRCCQGWKSSIGYLIS